MGLPAKEAKIIEDLVVARIEGELRVIRVSELDEAENIENRSSLEKAPQWLDPADLVKVRGQVLSLLAEPGTEPSKNGK